MFTAAIKNIASMQYIAISCNTSANRGVCVWKISNETVYFAAFLDCDGSFCLQHHGEI